LQDQEKNIEDDFFYNAKENIPRKTKGTLKKNPYLLELSRIFF